MSPARLKRHKLDVTHASPSPGSPLLSRCQSERRDIVLQLPALCSALLAALHGHVAGVGVHLHAAPNKEGVGWGRRSLSPLPFPPFQYHFTSRKRLRE